MNRDELLTKLAMELAEWPDALEPRPQALVAADLYRPWKWWLSHSDGWCRLRRHGEVITRQDWLAERARLINKPSWDDAPMHAEWLAQNEDGKWFWFKPRPEIVDETWGGDLTEEYYIEVTQGIIPAGHDWRETLEQWPAETIPPEDTVDISELIWTGDGLPPAGAKIRFRYRGDTPVPAMVEAVTREFVVVSLIDSGNEVAARIELCDMLPFRSEEDEAIDRMLHVGGADDDPMNFVGFCRALYREGYRQPGTQ